MNKGLILFYDQLYQAQRDKDQKAIQQANKMITKAMQTIESSNNAILQINKQIVQAEYYKAVASGKGQEYQPSIKIYEKDSFLLYTVDMKSKITNPEKPEEAFDIETYLKLKPLDFEVFPYESKRISSSHYIFYFWNPNDAEKGYKFLKKQRINPNVTITRLNQSRFTLRVLPFKMSELTNDFKEDMSKYAGERIKKLVITKNPSVFKEQDDIIAFTYRTWPTKSNETMCEVEIHVSPEVMSRVAVFLLRNDHNLPKISLGPPALFKPIEVKFNPKLCFTCFEYGHFTPQCKNKNPNHCIKCGSDDHEINNCQGDWRCSQCIKNGFTMDINHRPSASRCPIMLKRRNEELEKMLKTPLNIYKPNFSPPQ